MNKKWNILYGLILLLTVTAEVLAALAVKRLNMLPDNYMAAFVAVLAVFALIVGLLLFVKGKKSGKARRIIAAVFAVIVICGCVALRTVSLDIIETLQLTSTDTLEITTREIYVLEENPAIDLLTADEYTFGYIKDYDEACTAQVFDYIREQLGEDITTAGYTNTLNMVSAFLDQRIDAMILNGGLLEIIQEEPEFEDISEKVRLLTQVRVFETNNAASTMPQEEETAVKPDTQITLEETDTIEETAPMDFSELKPFAVYVSGSDSHDKQIVKSGRSDVNILAIVNPLTKQILLINTPRDYYVPNAYAGGTWEERHDKLTHCGIYGTKCSMKTLSNLYGVDIEYFVRINFTGFKKMIDAIGGVTVYSDYEFMAIGRTPIKVGQNELNGQEALDFARERKRVPGGDADRGRHQMKVITAVIDKATSGTTIISNYSEIMESVEGMFEMNVPAELISELMKMQLSDMARWNVVSYSATGGFAAKECYSMPGVEVSVIQPSYNSVNKASLLIDMVFAGELLTEEVINSIT